MLIEDKWTKSTKSAANGQCLEAKWTKATASSGSGQCVEAKVNDAGLVAVRDSKDPQGPVLLFTPDEWEAFLDGAKKGEFDLPYEAIVDPAVLAAVDSALTVPTAEWVRRERPAEVA